MIVRYYSRLSEEGPKNNINKEEIKKLINQLLHRALAK